MMKSVMESLIRNTDQYLIFIIALMFFVSKFKRITLPFNSVKDEKYWQKNIITFIYFISLIINMLLAVTLYKVKTSNFSEILVEVFVPMFIANILLYTIVQSVIYNLTIKLSVPTYKINYDWHQYYNKGSLECSQSFLTTLEYVNTKGSGIYNEKSIDAVLYEINRFFNRLFQLSIIFSMHIVLYKMLITHIVSAI